MSHRARHPTLTRNLKVPLARQVGITSRKPNRINVAEDDRLMASGPSDLDQIAPEPPSPR